MTSNIFAVACPVCFSERVMPMNKWYTECLHCQATLLAPQIPGYKYIRTSCGNCVVWNRVPLNENKTECTCGKAYFVGLFRERLTWCGQEVHFAGVGTPFNVEAELCFPMHPEKIAGTNEHAMKKMKFEKDELELKLKDSTMQVKDKNQLHNTASQRAGAEIDSLEKKLEETASLLENKERALRLMKANHEREMSLAVRKRVEMIAEAAKKKDEMEAVELAFVQLEASLAEATKEISQLRERCEDAERDVYNITEYLESHKELLELSRAMVDEDKEEKESVTKKYEAQKKVLEKKEDDLFLLSNVNEDLKSKLEIYIKEYMDKVAELAEAKSEIKELKTMSGEKNKVIRTLREMTKNMTEAHSKAETQAVVNAHDEQQQKPENVAPMVASSTNTLHVSLAKQGDLSGDKNNLSSLTDELKCKYDAAKKRFAKVCDEAKEVKEERDRLREENKQLLAMNTLAIRKIQKLTLGGDEAKKEN